jgi:crotonobetainyl-CoA:carnitine CoA-transferase CaiB-like acyl-CoA transferase
MPALADAERFFSNVKRVRNRAETDAQVAAVFAGLTAAELQARLQAADIAFARVNDMAALSSHPHLRRMQVESAAGPIAIPAPGPLFAGQSHSFGRVPALGEHTGSVLAEIDDRKRQG